MLSSIYSCDNLTNYQQEEIFHDYYFKSKEIYDKAFQNSIYEEIELSSYDNHYLEQWIKEDRRYAFWCLNDTINRIVRLENLEKLTTFNIDNLFVIARGVANEEMVPGRKRDAINEIIKCGFDLLNSKKSRNETKKEIIRQLKWLDFYLQKEKDLAPLKEEHSNKIKKLK